MPRRAVFLVKSVFRVSSLIFFGCEKHCRTRPTNIEAIHPNGANGPTEAINGRLETLRGIAFGFRNLDNYITRRLLHTGGFRQAVQTHL